MSGYFDANATTPLFPEVGEAVARTSREHWHNPSGLYHAAGAAKRMLEDAREEIADRLGIEEPERLIFTSGATEANNLVFAHLKATQPEKKVLVNSTEHPCVRGAARRAFGPQCVEIPVNPQGVVESGTLGELIDEHAPSLVSVMAANNETGVLQDWADFARLKPAFHCDAAQLLGKNLESSAFDACDWVVGSAHKFGGPKGVGFLVVPEDLDALEGSSVGGPQERGFRAGTENLPGVEGMRVALRAAQERCGAANADLRDEFERQLKAAIPGTRILGESVPRLWNTSMFVLPEFRNTRWLSRLSQAGFAVSTGSACSSGAHNPSPVMTALGMEFDEMSRVIRVSSLWETTEDDWGQLLAAIIQVWREFSEGTGPKQKISLCK